MAIFMTLILPNHKHGMFLRLLCPLLFRWAVVCSSPWRGPLRSLLSYIPRYFILFVAIVNGSSLLIWLSLSLLLEYRNACDFCTVILYPETLLKLLIKVLGDFGLRWWGLLDILSCCLQIPKQRYRPMEQNRGLRGNTTYLQPSGLWQTWQKQAMGKGFPV